MADVVEIPELCERCKKNAPVAGLGGEWLCAEDFEEKLKQTVAAVRGAMNVE